MTIKHAHGALSAAVLAALGANAALAQTAPPAPTEQADLQEIVVTGSMIKRANAETAEAITILKTDQLK